MTEAEVSIIHCVQHEDPAGELWEYTDWSGQEKVYLLNGYDLVENKVGEKGYIIHDLRELNIALNSVTTRPEQECCTYREWTVGKVKKGLEND